MADIAKHKREHDMLIGFLERPALQWLAARMPAWVTPDVLTGIGVAASMMIFVGYWLTNRSPWWLLFVNLGFVINWFGDSLDGTLARYRKIERPKFGFYIDHTVDAVAEFLTIIGIGMSPYLRLDVAAFALIGYLLMSVHVYIRTAVEGVFKISYGRFGPTEMRVIIMLVNTAILVFEPFFLREVVSGLKPFDVVGIVLAAAMGAVFLGASWVHAVRLAKEGK
ncbi:CDP-alcohol phosphatidyltransferase family protein [Coriobacteriia bacterium Es71-Z0120]|uniref:CDP-alcohol phosphatidyltransferase family protein n=1 Tax=Parvivirga hydrogeniphila TaxID=2939460 RepID=UPI00226081BB|nr:CDP-alcohol phosphatidyltransferase family protein [Parvivirga hydrogeniphila]MCL4079449.1 CDP-alcohol phosphatidyltransferase family protein [Parvivirga hydrogeniphila]